MRTPFLYIVVIGAVCSPMFAGAQDLCGPPKPPVELGQGASEAPKETEEEGSEVRMFEYDFELGKALAAVGWLEGISETIERSKTLDDLRGIDFEFPFHNNTTVTKGAILRQQALLERERLEVARLKLKLASGTKADVDVARKRYLAARANFCKFLKNAGWAD
jgi:hypothetical protein